MVVSTGFIVDTEYKPLRVVLLCQPHPRIGDITDPSTVLHVKRMDPAAAKQEHLGIAETYRKLGIAVHFIKVDQKTTGDDRFLYNLMFTRDLFFMTPRGAIMAKMFSDVRRHEVTYAKKVMGRLGIFVRKVIEGNATFEGADALWVNEKLVIVGVGKRTNEAGFIQIREELKKDGIACIKVPAPRGALHLLGAVQWVDACLAVVRVDALAPEIVKVLKRYHIKMIKLKDNLELTRKHAMNFVTIAPKQIIMPAGCPQTKKHLQGFGIKIAAEVRIAQLVNGGGGLACATGILSRSEQHDHFSRPGG